MPSATQHELNLLPPDRRQVLRRLHILHLGAALMRTGAIGLLGITLAAVTIIGSLRVMALRADLNAPQELVTAEAERTRLRDELTDHDAILKSLISLETDRVDWIDLLRQIVDAAPEGTKLTQLSAVNGTLAGDSGVSLAISGQAVSRASLAAFENNLRMLAAVQSVEAPTNNLLAPVNPVFSLSLVLKELAEKTVETVITDDAAGPGGPEGSIISPTPGWSLGRLVTAGSSLLLVIVLLVAWWQRHQQSDF